MDNHHVYDQGFDFGSFINFPEDSYIESNIDFQFPTEDVSADLSFSDMQLIPDMDFSQYDASVNTFDTFEHSASSSNESPLTDNYESFDPQAEDFRFLVESWASTDQRSRSMKQKRRDAAIDLHLQRFRNTHTDFQLCPTDSEFSFSNSPSNSCSQSSQQSPVACTPVSSTSHSDRSVPQTGGQELVFDINLNTATNLPKKQKKRTQAQIDDYINARRNGACLKHKKQHKKCNCHEKQSAKVALDAKRKRKATLSKVVRPAPEPVATSPFETPSTISRSSFSPSIFSQVDSQSFNQEIDSALASLDDLNDMERWANLVSHGSMTDPSDQYYQTGSFGLLPYRHHTINTPEVSTNLQTSGGYLPQQGESFNHLLGLRDGTSHGGSLSASGLVTTGGLSGLTEVTSGLMSNVSFGQTGVRTAGLSGLVNAQGQVSAPTQQLTANSLVHTGTTPLRPEDTSTLVQNIPPVQLGSPGSSTMALTNAQQQPSTPFPQVLPTTSSLVSPAASLGRSVQQGLPVEIVAPASNVERQAVSVSTLPQLSSTPAPVPAPLPAVAHSPIAWVPSARQESSADVMISALLDPGLFSALRAPALASAMLKDVQQTVYLAGQEFYGIATAFLSAVYWMSELCAMALQGLQQVAILPQSTLFMFAEQLRQRNFVTNNCASALSDSLSLGRPMALRV